MKPIIGVLPLYDKAKESIWMLPGYLDRIKNAGGIPIILPYGATKEELEKLNKGIDGYLFTGGNDVNPEFYKAKRKHECGPIDSLRDNSEKILYQIAKRDDKPILGICRGIQQINVLEGGSLYQDLPTDHPSKVIHHLEYPYDRKSHSVYVFSNSPLGELIKTDSLEVNSLHHQALRRIASSLRSMAVSEDGLVEAIYHPKMKFMWAVQWHPEYMLENENASKKIFKAFIDSIKA
jgi:putative glutamine amidotransferase